MANKIIAISESQKEKLDVLKNTYIYKTKKHMKWIPFMDFVIKLAEKEIDNMPEFKAPVIKEKPVEPEPVEVVDEDDPNFSD